MNEPGKKIVQQLFGEVALAEVGIRTIEQTVSRYPYFGPAQFLLAKKLKESNSYNSEAQLQKAALYFSNPYWLNFLLSEKITTNNDILVADTSTEQEHITNITNKEPEPIAEVKTVAYEQEFLTENTEAENTVSTAETALLHNELSITVAEVPLPEAVQPEIINETTATAHTIDIEEDAFIQEEEEYVPAADEADDTDPQRLKLSSIIEQHLADFKKPVDDTKELIIQSNPYHTVDYFASQGIKADGQDKLSSRVRKFTDWLKQMKAPNAQPTDLGTDAETEQIIETIAQSSNQTKDIITEAMAEVLVKQGKTEKARQLYKKLSFLNPAKSTYFVGKIEELNSK